MVGPIFPLVRRCARLVTWGLLVVLASSGAWGAPKLRIGVQRNAPPLSFLDKEGNLQGFTPELVSAMGRLGLFEPQITVDYWKPNWDRFSEGRLDVIADAAITDERRATVDFSIASATTHAVLFQRDDAAPLLRSSQFRGRTIGVLTGTLSVAHMDAHPEIGARVVRYANQVDLLRAVRDAWAEMLRNFGTQPASQHDETPVLAEAAA